MVDTGLKLRAIVHDHIERGDYFTINRPRQYGKTTTLFLLAQALTEEQLVIAMSFEGNDTWFGSPALFAYNFRLDIRRRLADCGEESLAEIWDEEPDERAPEQYLRRKISETCKCARKPVVLMIDEVDKATNYQVFNAFLGLLRDMYLNRKKTPAFQSVILAGVTDIKNLKRQIRPEEHKGVNSPWNIAADFMVDMSFSVSEISGMLRGYEMDHGTGMDMNSVAERIFFYTGGYPFLVSKLCKMIDEGTKDWTVQGVDDAETRLLGEKNTLFDDLRKNILNDDALRTMAYSMLLQGADVGYDPDNPVIDSAMMYGIVRAESGKMRIANIIFETRITNLLISLSETRALGERYASETSFFIKDGKLDMDAVMCRFASFMKTEYRDKDSAFIEANARLLFLTFLKPIINGTGHYAVEPETRGGRRMDIRVLYGREEQIVELKIWRGEKYEQEGIAQLAGYLGILEHEKGWLLSFCDLKKTPRQGGVYEVDGRVISETVVAFRDEV
jgi:hypothetical protein